ncbi:hypothetical protein MTO96_023971, partial [Rhipicephalus appendiculatus]
TDTAARRHPATSAPPAEHQVEAGGTERVRVPSRGTVREARSRSGGSEIAPATTQVRTHTRGAHSSKATRSAGTRDLASASSRDRGSGRATQQQGYAAADNSRSSSRVPQRNRAKLASLTTDATGPAVARRARKSRGFVGRGPFRERRTKLQNNRGLCVRCRRGGSL